MMSTPFFSIGIPTFNRPEMLLQAISSLTEQTFADFEVIVGNSYTKDHLTCETMDIYDPRIRFINHPADEGVVAGYSVLPFQAKGRYFTWLADDDLFAPDFLKIMHSALSEFKYPHAAFSTYMMGANYDLENIGTIKEPHLFDGKQFLNRYLSKKLKVVGCYGIFDRQYLIQNRSMELLAEPESPYSDNLLAIRAGKLEKVIYIDSPLVFFRAHDNSISYKSTEASSYAMAQKNLCIKYVGLYRNGKNREEFQENLYLLLKWCINDFAAVVRRSNSIHFRNLIRYLPFLKSNLAHLRGTEFYWKIIRLFAKKIIGIF